MCNAVLRNTLYTKLNFRKERDMKLKLSFLDNMDALFMARKRNNYNK